MGRRQLQDPVIDRVGVGHVAECEIIVDRRRQQPPRRQRMPQQAAQFGGEGKGPVGQERVIERLFAEPVASQEQLLPPAVPQREREHPFEPVEARRPPALPGMHDRFGVAVGAEDMAARQQLRPQRGVIVDLAVEDDRDRFIFVKNRLLAAFKIDDRQPPMSEPHPRFDMKPLAVGAAMRKRRGHPAQHGQRDGTAGIGGKNAGDPAHGLLRLTYCALF